MQWNPAGSLPGGLSPDAYMDKRLRPLDAEHYSAAGILQYRKREDGIELLLPLERPWNSFTQAYDPLGWNIFGGKRVPRQERSAETTAVRCFLENVGHIDGAPDTEVLYEMLGTSCTIWYPAGKFALLIVQVPDELMSDFPDRFAADKKQSGGSEEFRILPMGIKKYVKQIDALEWVPVSKLLPQPQGEISDLLGNILHVADFREFLEGKLDPATAWPQSGNGAPERPPPDSGKGAMPDFAGFKGKGWQKGGGAKGKGKWGGGKNAYGGGGGFKGKWGKPMPMYAGMPGMPGGLPGKGGPAFPPMMYPPYDQNSAEMQRQMYGEQLYLMVQPLSPSPYLAQKITGMLLELPQNELLLNLTNQEELSRRVAEALDVLKEDGLVA